MFKLLVTGANGQLAKEIADLSIDYDYEFFFINKRDLDITNFDFIRNFIIKNSINIIINCAAYTAVDKAEIEVDLANRINNIAVENLAKISKDLAIKLIHISTDYVFDGKNFKPYIETDAPNPQSVYGNTKYSGEIAMQKVNPKDSIIIRTSWVYSCYGNNFLKTILKLANGKDTLNVVYDQIGTPTYAKDLAKIILQILPQIDNNKVEIYHYSNEGTISWYEFAKEIMKEAKLSCKVNPLETKDYPTLAKRPHFSILNKTKIKTKFNIEIPYWKDSLNDCLKRLGKKE